MRTAHKWITLAIALIVVGAAVCAASFAAFGFNFKGLSTASYVTNTYEVSEKFSDVSISADTEKVAFVPSEDGKCKVVCREDEKMKHRVSVEKGVLTIRVTDDRNWTDHFGINIDEAETTVYLPAETTGSLRIETHTGDIEIPGDFTFESIGIKGSTADVRCGASAKGRLEIGTSTGDITLSDLEAAEISLSVSTGKISAGNVDCQGNADVHVQTGRAVLQNFTCGNLSSDGSTGDLTLEKVTAADTFNLKRSTGDIRFDGSDAETIYVRTSTGKVSGTLLSDKVFITETDTGSVDVPKTVTGGRCEISTDTGNIKIQIQ